MPKENHKVLSLSEKKIPELIIGRKLLHVEIVKFYGKNESSVFQIIKKVKYEMVEPFQLKQLKL